MQLLFVICSYLATYLAIYILPLSAMQLIEQTEQILVLPFNLSRYRLYLSVSLSLLKTSGQNILLLSFHILLLETLGSYSDLLSSALNLAPFLILMQLSCEKDHVIHTGDSRPDIQRGQSMNVVYDLRVQPPEAEGFGIKMA